MSFVFVSHIFGIVKKNVYNVHFSYNVLYEWSSNEVFSCCFLYIYLWQRHYEVLDKWAQFISFFPNHIAPYSGLIFFFFSFLETNNVVFCSFCVKKNKLSVKFNNSIVASLILDKYSKDYISSLIYLIPVKWWISFLLVYSLMLVYCFS